MMTLGELLDSIVQWLQSTGEEGRSLWEALVASSRKIGAVGCDGLLLNRAVDHGEDLLRGLPEEYLRDVWKESENGFMAVAEGVEEIDAASMILDINVDLYQVLGKEICRAATDTVSRRGAEQPRQHSKYKLQRSKGKVISDK